MLNKYISEKCHVCDGSGKLSHPKFGDDTCWMCKGTGFIPNEEGYQILDLVTRFMKNSFYMNYKKNQFKPTVEEDD
jgi:RecJ-like exonuclease